MSVEMFSLRTYAYIYYGVVLYHVVSMGEGPKRRLELVNCGVQSRPSTQNRARRLYLDLDLTETCTRQIHFW